MNVLTEKKQFLTFNIEEILYGIDINAVTEIIGIQQITLIPEMPHFIKGIINLRGKIIPILDVRLRINKVERTYDDRTCIIVINYKEDEVGLIVDCVQEVISIQDEAAMLMTDHQLASGEFISQVIRNEEKIYMIMDLEKLIVVEI